MNTSYKLKIAVALSVLSVLGFVPGAIARENVKSSSHKEALKATASSCEAATAAIDLDINNVRARLMTGGDMWWNIGLSTAAYEIPKSSGRHSQFAASCWIGGYDKQGQLKVAAQTYRQDGNDYWPGALDKNASITKEVCANWDRFWKIDKSTIIAFIEEVKAAGGSGTAALDKGAYTVIKEWPGRGNKFAMGAKSELSLDATTEYAPYVEVDSVPGYTPAGGDYPDIKGDQFIWWVSNDAGNTKQQTGTPSMGIEVQTSAFAYATQDYLNNATFYNYRVINRGALTVDSTYIAVWDDCDLGYYLDDYIGCDTFRGLGIMYNGSANDGQDGGYPPNSYGANPPQVGVDFFQGPKKKLPRPAGSKTDTFQQLGMTNFTYYNNDFSIIGNPSNGQQIYNYMTGSIRNGDRFSNDFQGAGVTSKGYGSGPTTNFVFTGDPGDKTTWSECTCGNTKGDRRFIFSSGPFVLEPGAVNDIVFGSVWAGGVGGCPNTDFKTIKAIDDEAQGLFISKFKTVEGPEAPRLVVRELNKRLIFYIVNDYGSNNFAENYGRDDVAGSANYRDSLKYHQIITRAKDISTDTLYKFEGYRVFQLANGQVAAADIFDPSTGEVDETKAKEVFQCDIQNGVTKIVNYTKRTSVSDSTWIPQLKVSGKDSGIAHSFQLTQDEFSLTSEKQFINYRTYYFVAIAYAYNNFSKFDSRYYSSTQDKPYIGSAHAAGGTNIPVVAAMPNPANGEVGTTLNADYGSGVVITRVQGIGNSGHELELSDSSAEAAMMHDSVGVAVYKKGKGPFDVKVIDPVKVPAYDWVLQIKGNMNGEYLSKNASWSLIAKNGNTVVDTIYSERDLSVLNEQIADKYGISIAVEQVLPPGQNQKLGNGYITSSIEFEDKTDPWLFGIKDQSDSNFANWIRSGTKRFVDKLDATTAPCNFSDLDVDSFQAYQNLLPNFSPVTSTWAPYSDVGYWVKGTGHRGTGTQCAMLVAYSYNTQNKNYMGKINDVNIVLTNDKTMWTKCAVIEEQEDTLLAQNRAAKFSLRSHAGWTGTCDKNGTPIYSDSTKDRGTSWFPGYAIDQGTGQRLNIVFGEDSYLSSDNGADMIWNPTSSDIALDGSKVWGGKHFIFITGTKYDSGRAFVNLLRSTATNPFAMEDAYKTFRWVGIPILNSASKLRSVADGIVPGKVTIRFRVNRPYAPYAASDTTSSSLVNITPGKASQPYYTFSTASLTPSKLADNSDRQALLDNIRAVPNPYYGYSGYETNRFDTKVRITNVPARTTVRIYALDGTLIRTISKSDPTVPYLDWDIRNSAGLPVASGMYLMHVKAEGLGETVIKWFGATRPIDAPTY
ncbi:MAG: hypothetical protein EBZ77_00155 [Chitinophagia bacterium]|nr:hypothetical protein [Chitinophagia bacterium]